MPKFAITPHFRLHEWVAEDKGYFKAQGLDYEFHGIWEGQDLAKAHATPNKVGAYQSFEKGRDTNVSCACHWTVNVAASAGHGKLYADCYSVAPAGVFVPPESDIRHPEDLRGVPISVGYQSGSHYSTIQALEQYMPLSDIKLSFADGILFSRLEKLIDRQVPAAALFSGPYYFLEQLGFRKVIDTSFMMATMITGNPHPGELKKYFGALRLAQRDIDLRPELYTRHYRNEFPQRFLPQVDTRRWGPGERIVFEPYTKEVFEESFKWIREREIFAPGTMGEGRYEDACISLAQVEP
jgi:ABC-type nitrate/sulfonate/bicarbonate transport system substrate-binding protein